MAIRDGVARIYIFQLARLPGKTIGTRIFGLTARLIELARAAGAKKIRIEAEIKEITGTLKKALERQGWKKKPYSDYEWYYEADL